MKNCSRSADSTTACSNCSTRRWPTATAWPQADSRYVERMMRIMRLSACAHLRLAAALFASLLLAGCYAGYLARAAYEESRILWHRKPIDDALARKDLPEDIRAKLETVLAVRKF